MPAKSRMRANRTSSVLGALGGQYVDLVLTPVGRSCTECMRRDLVCSHERLMGHPLGKRKMWVRAIMSFNEHRRRQVQPVHQMVKRMIHWCRGNGVRATMLYSPHRPFYPVATWTLVVWYPVEHNPKERYQPADVARILSEREQETLQAWLGGMQ